MYSNERMDDRLCLLVILGVTDQGSKELVTLEDDFRESEASCYEIIVPRQHQLDNCTQAQ